MAPQQVYNEFIKLAIFSLVGWIAIQVTDLKQNMAGVAATVTSEQVRTGRIADAVVRLMGANTEQDKVASDIAQRVSKLEAKNFK